MIAKLTSKNQLTLPKKIVSQFPRVQYFTSALLSVRGFTACPIVSPDQFKRMRRGYVSVFQERMNTQQRIDDYGEEYGGRTAAV